MLKSVNEEQLDDLINQKELFLIDFWAPWCAPCKEFGRIYEALAEQNPEINFVKINIEEEPGIAEAFQIRSIPHLMIIKEGIAIYSDSGSMPASTLTELLQQAKAIDVAEILTKMNQDEGL
ncbi:thioredoxin [Legionella birminghamensis]|uniref:Thioredoxin n=1 Tax=Legionella birminghamensis TaxID=28083 RepID=A0A378IGU9_9GAMM|nr:thioredoxin [Legionella birminghamensis]STX31414.1 thioredoxin [Legionella birminghamensis]